MKPSVKKKNLNKTKQKPRTMS